MEQNTPTSAPSSIPVSTASLTPTWLKVIFKIYGSIQILLGIFGVIFPFFATFIALGLANKILTPNEVSGFFYTTFGFLLAAGLSSFVLGYGFLKIRKWIIVGLIIPLPLELFYTITHILWRQAVPFLDTSLLVIQILILIIALTYRSTLTGKYFAFIPITILIFAEVVVGIQTNEAAKNVALGVKRIHTGVQEISTNNGLVSFTVGSDVDYQNWGTATSSLELVFTDKDAFEDTSNNSCTPGATFIEVTEEEGSYSRNADNDFKLNDHTETYGNNTYEVYNLSAAPPSVKYFLLHFSKSDIKIIYRPDYPYVNGKNYQTDLDTLLKTFTYQIVDSASDKSASSTGVSNADSPNIVSGIKITPGINTNLLDADLLSEIKHEVLTAKDITTKEGCVTYAELALSSKTATERATGLAMVNACVYYLENGK